jgi:hypothetical protein
LMAPGGESTSMPSADMAVTFNSQQSLTVCGQDKRSARRGALPTQRKSVTLAARCRTSLF